jgi:RimJ/RimL family protein N-acetyltransferase
MANAAPDWDWAWLHNSTQGELRLRLAADSDLAFVRECVCDPATLEALGETAEAAEVTLRGLWAEGLSAPDMRHFVAELAGEGRREAAVRIAYLRLLYPFGEPQCLWLSFLVVAPGMRRRGYGLGVLQLVLAAAKSTRRVAKVGVHTRSTNLVAARLYESAGLCCTKREPWPTADGRACERLTFGRLL